MTKSLLIALTVLGGFALSGAPALTFMAGKAEAAQSTVQNKKKKVKTNFNQPKPKKRDYYGYPEEPNQAGMSSYCAFYYNVMHRRAVGCNKYGHSFMFAD